MDITELAIDLIDEDKAQPRYQFDEEALEELMKSIGEIGLLSPIKVRASAGGRYTIIYGNRRYKACKNLGLTAIPAIISTMTDATEIYLEQIAENLTREGFSPIEEAEAFHKLLTDPKFSSSTKFLSSKLGKPESYIKNKCELLKFGNAVKKLIVSGTEIRKDKLTEDQLLPLRDLALEHRDPLALIVARDEMPVSDVKRIARLFKDKSISAATKDKLLYKSGRDLLETWSVYEQNKAERAKPAPEKVKPAAAPKSVQTADASASVSTPASSATPAIPANPAAPTLTQTSNSSEVTNNASVTTTENNISNAANPLVSAPEQQLQHLLTTLTPNMPQSQEVVAAYKEMAPLDQASFHSGVELLLVHLEKQLAAWREIHELTQLNPK